MRESAERMSLENKTKTKRLQNTKSITKNGIIIIIITRIFRVA